MVSCGRIENSDLVKKAHREPNLSIGRKLQVIGAARQLIAPYLLQSFGIQDDDRIKIESLPILDAMEAINWTAAANRLMGTALTPQQVADLPEETLWIIGTMLDKATDG